MILVNYYKNLLVSSRSWIFAVLIIFACGVLTGVLISLEFPSTAKMVLANYASSVDFSTKPGLAESFYIFKRNVYIILLSIFSGILFGFFPAFVAWVNGFVFGIFLGFRPLYQVLNPWQIFLLLFPHGIFEYTASFLGLAFGLRLGLNWLLPGNRGKRLKALTKNIKETFFVAVLVVVILFIAALIEGNLTQRIACLLGNVCSALKRSSY